MDLDPHEQPISRRRAIALLAAVVAGTAGARALPAGAMRPLGRWTALADMPFAVQEVYPALFARGGAPMIVNAGGLAIGLTRPVKTATTIYDPVADEWREGVPLPSERHHLALAWSGAALHAIGGFARKGIKAWAMQDQNWRIDDPETGAWENARPLPTPQAEAVTIAHNGWIHVIGGRSPSGAANSDWGDHADVDAHHAYDPDADSWRRCAPLPVPRNSAAGAALGGELFVLSGRTVAEGNTPACHAYDPDADSWRALAPLPTPTRQVAPTGQGGLAAATFGGKLYAFGGEWFSGAGGVYADAWEYDPHTDVWRAVAGMIRPRHGLGGVAIEGHGEIDGIYAIGGALERGGAGVTPFLDKFEI